MEATKEPGCVFDSVDMTFGHYDSDTEEYSCSFTTEHWLYYRVADILIALVHNSQIPIALLYGRDEAVSNVYLKRLMTNDQRQFCVRHGWKAQIGAKAETKAGDANHDPASYHRQATNVLKKSWRAAWNLHQHCSEDEGVKSGKHLGGARIRMNKPGVHSGHLVHTLADACWPYTYHMEEEKWRKDQTKDKVFRRMTKRLRYRNHIIWKDRGYTMCAADEDFSVNEGIHTAGTMKDNSKDVPTQEIARLKQEIPEYHYACMHKGNSEIIIARQAQHKKCLSIFSNVHSAARTVQMIRGAHKSWKVIELWAPECWGDYSNCYRSGVDVTDQWGQMYRMADRRMEKNPYKSLVWYEDRAVDNKCTIFRYHNQTVTRGGDTNKMLAWTKTEFLLAAIHDLCDGVTMRQRRPYMPHNHKRPALAVELSGEAAPPVAASPSVMSSVGTESAQQTPSLADRQQVGAGAEDEEQPEHELRQFKKGDGLQIPGRKSKSTQGHCCGRACKKEPSSWCIACVPARCYCMPCFFKAHRCVLRP